MIREHILQLSYVIYLFTYLLFPALYHLYWIFAHILSLSLVFVLQVRSGHQRTHICARLHASCLACRRPSFAWNWPVGETRPMPSTSASLERKFMAQVRISPSHLFLYWFVVGGCFLLPLEAFSYLTVDLFFSFNFYLIFINKSKIYALPSFCFFSCIWHLYTLYPSIQQIKEKKQTEWSAPTYKNINLKNNNK